MKRDNSFDDIYVRYSKRVYNYTLSKCHNRELTEDITQTTFLKAIEHADSFRNDCDIYTWLCQIARNTLLDELSRHDNRNISIEYIENEENLLVSDTDILSELISEEEKEILYKKIHWLDERQKEIIFHRLLGLSFKEIGAVFEQSETWARVNYYRAKEKLQQKLREDKL